MLTNAEHKGAKIVIFRVDFGDTTGLGHLMRSLVYAKKFDKVVYISKSEKREFVPHRLITINSEEEFFAQTKRLQPKKVVVDNYDFTYRDEKRFKELFPNIKLTVFDDDYREHFCDEIINHNISAKKENYPNPKIIKIIPPLIRDEFKKEKAIKREKIYDIFIAMGGTDSTNLNTHIVEILPKNLKIALLTTSSNKNLKELRKYILNKKNISLHIDSNEVAKLLNQSKFAIITPSVIVHEVLYMDIPFVAIKTTENQNDIYLYLKRHGHKTLKEFSKKGLKQCVSS